MHTARVLLILGIWVAILPYLGFPLFLKNILFAITGLIFIYISFKLYKENRTVEKVFENFSENINIEEDETI